MLILKSQNFSEEELVQFAQNLSSRDGDLKDKLLHWDFGPVMNMKYDINAQNYLFSGEHVPFHWDGAFYKEPMKILFYCTESQGIGGETIFTNTEKIWKSLTAAEQDLCRKVTMVYRTEKRAHYGGEIRVPLVQKHPVTGEIILRIAERVETHLNPVELEMTGIPNAEELYSYLRQLLYQPEFLYEHSWQAGDLLVADNFTYLHGRRQLGLNKMRSFKRIQIL